MRVVIRKSGSAKSTQLSASNNLSSPTTSSSAPERRAASDSELGPDDEQSRGETLAANAPVAEPLDAIGQQVQDGEQREAQKEPQRSANLAYHTVGKSRESGIGTCEKRIESATGSVSCKHMQNRP